MTPTLLHHQRCSHHPAREAVARCPSCASFYCRECVVEHAGRLLCTRCLARQASVQARGGRWAEFGWLLAAAAGLLFSWMTFYYAGALLSRIPAEFHGGVGP